MACFETIFLFSSTSSPLARRILILDPEEWESDVSAQIRGCLSEDGDFMSSKYFTLGSSECVGIDFCGWDRLLERCPQRAEHPW
jgi:hypothetical protein